VQTHALTRASLPAPDATMSMRGASSGAIADDRRFGRDRRLHPGVTSTWFA
jgi:hypothetical protein